MTFSNQLTDAQAERLAMLAEECAEVIQIVGKILRHGYSSINPEGGQLMTNRQLLAKELVDVAAVSAAIHGRDRVPDFNMHDMDKAWEKKLRYASHQEELTHD